MSKLSFDFAYLEAQVMESRETDTEEAAATTTLDEMNKFKLALKIALESSNHTGVYECMFKIIQKSIALATQMKYNAENLSEQQRNNFSYILGNVTKHVINDKDLQQFIG
jgi:hypothetical protein